MGSPATDVNFRKAQLTLEKTIYVETEKPHIWVCPSIPGRWAMKHETGFVVVQWQHEQQMWMSPDYGVGYTVEHSGEWLVYNRDTDQMQGPRIWPAGENAHMGPFWAKAVEECEGFFKRQKEHDNRVAELRAHEAEVQERMAYESKVKERLSQKPSRAEQKHKLSNWFDQLHAQQVINLPQMKLNSRRRRDAERVGREGFREQELEKKKAVFGEKTWYVCCESGLLHRPVT
ncbi:hypothetical protein BDV95DRAFT_567576 [Massariosphaeria phaeospora]|uniref:Uncharacterized protein n=1 Tax=Massariosphaeria phaeospora TaxID=100035 RepID=A0A7C8MHV9_9PLEO|nr:hypothetical protein BDV95DRAFT_567576 [Massariosphaeria phaeospora]